MCYWPGRGRVPRRGHRRGVREAPPPVAGAVTRIVTLDVPRAARVGPCAGYVRPREDAGPGVAGGVDKDDPGGKGIGYCQRRRIVGPGVGHQQGVGRRGPRRDRVGSPVLTMERSATGGVTSIPYLAPR